MSSDTRQNQTRYWCHICNAEVSIYMAPDPTCQQCNEQFIEELHSDDDPREFLAGTDREEPNRIPESTQFFSFSPPGRLNNEIGDDLFQFFSRQPQPAPAPAQEPAPRPSSEQQQDDETRRTSDNPTPLGNFVQNLLTNMLGQNVDISQTNNTDPTRPMVFFGNMVDGNMRFQPMPSNGAMPGGMPEGNEGEGDENNRGNSIASLLQLISAMAGSPIDGGLAGNPNDYVFSQTALDNIITQLMEQTGGASAPPPAPEEVIEALVKRSLTDKEKAQETDCAVCKDHFELEEQVIELPCEHIFHDECIKPWLKLNSTCPVCRHSVLPDNQNRDSSNDDDTHQNTNTDTPPPPQAENDRSTTANTNSNTATASFTFTSTSGPNGQQQQLNMPASWPLNISASFPWVNQNMTRQASPFSSSTPPSSTNPNNNSTSNEHNNQTIDDDLDLD